ncbi:MAG: hypothetical protein KTR19_13275 [Hyphomicrobiales bacterium]|nr:hypothetical protein [Hyphomicrobiales bacterium]
MTQNNKLVHSNAGASPRNAEEIFLSWARYGLPLVIIGWALLLLYILVDVLSGAPASGNFVGFAMSLMLTGFAIAILASLEKIRTTLGRVLMYQTAAVALPARSKPLETPPAAAPKETVVERGDIDGRRYIAFTDGTVIVETKFGRRRFGSIKDAQDFIGV